MVHEVVGRQIDDVLGRVGLADRMGDAVEQVRLAQANGGMDIDRIEGHGIVDGGAGDLPGNAEGHLVGRAGNEAVKGHARVDGAAIEGVAGLGIVQHQARHGGRCSSGRRGIVGRRRLGSSFHHRRQARAGLAIDPHGHLQAGRLGHVIAEGLDDPIGIVGLHPGTEEARGRTQMHQVIDDFLELEPGEPGREHILADGRFETGAHAGPEFTMVGRRKLWSGHDRSAAFARNGGRG